ncbi:MAG: hypothetical protein K2G31_00060, partial [Clostridia bacterium]|nr:hypothetical protein [Clostridia bacterium]
MGKVRKSLKNAMWLIVAAICFVTVFGLVMAFDTGAIGDTELSQVAEAAESENKVNTYGNASPVQSSITLSDIVSTSNSSTKFMVNALADTTGTWKATDNSVLAPQTTLNTGEMQKTGGDTKCYIKIGEGTEGSIEWGVTNSPWASNDAEYLINYKISDALMNLINNSNGISVKAKISTTYRLSTCGYGHFRAFSTNEAKKASDYLCSGHDSLANDKDHALSAEVAITSGNNYLALVWGLGFGYKTGGANRYAYIKGLSIEFEITFTAPARNTSTVFDDGSA